MTFVFVFRGGKNTGTIYFLFYKIPMKLQLFISSKLLKSRIPLDEKIYLWPRLHLSCPTFPSLPFISFCMKKYFVLAGTTIQCCTPSCSRSHCHSHSCTCTCSCSSSCTSSCTCPSSCTCISSPSTSCYRVSLQFSIYWLLIIFSCIINVKCINYFPLLKFSWGRGDLIWYQGRRFHYNTS